LVKPKVEVTKGVMKRKNKPAGRRDGDDGFIFNGDRGGTWGTRKDLRKIIEKRGKRGRNDRTSSFLRLPELSRGKRSKRKKIKKKESREGADYVKSELRYNPCKARFIKEPQKKKKPRKTRKTRKKGLNNLRRDAHYSYQVHAREAFK